MMIGHAGSAFFPKSSRRKQPAFERIIDERGSRATGRVMGIVPDIYIKLVMPH